MSYNKMMRQIRTKRKGIKQGFHGFSTLGETERRSYPLLPKAWFDKIKHLSEEEQQAALDKRNREWQEETERLLKVNPNLKIID